jgi:hypothetical protein
MTHAAPAGALFAHGGPWIAFLLMSAAKIRFRGLSAKKGHKRDR